MWLPNSLNVSYILYFGLQPEVHTLGRRQSKTLILSRNVDHKSIETVFSIAICRPTVRQMAIENTVSIDF